MAMFDFQQITVGPEKLRARVAVDEGAPVRTSEDVEATARVYYLAPAIAGHLCLGDAGERFQDCMGDTWTAHLLEHLTVEIMAETGLAGDISCGRTRRAPDGGDREFEVELSCPDDALTVGALSSAAFMMEWAFRHPDQPAPDFPGTVAALRGLMLKLRGEDEGAASGAPAASNAAGADVPADANPAPTGPIDVEGAAAEASDGVGGAVFGGAAAGAAQAPRA